MGSATADRLAALFENAPRFMERLRAERAENGAEPAENLSELVDRAERLAATLTEEEQVELINGHPRIGADPATVSATSFREQGYDHTPPATEPQLAARLARLNDAYEERLGFRFVVFVAGRPRSDIADFLETRLDANRDEELARALHDVFAIARDRLLKEP
jgi:2-oxo-4-hydroxy-4-carboxy--5-ureidoimidazoline (OHCU) decarboxylase